MENADNDYSIIFSHVKKAYGKTVVINDLNLEIRKGERLILLGPSGCGKTTTLRMIAGFDKITSGDLFLDGKVVNNLAPGERNIAMVFQSYALFPHLSVWDNITFGLKIKKLAAKEIAERTKKAIEIVHLEGQEHKKIHELSGGQKQRVALCRAIVKQSPYFLLDEPLSNLDAKLRQQARAELIKIHELSHPTMVYVTHDQIEAMTVAHRIAVMHQGKIQQIDTPDAIYNHPQNTFVATFIGSPAMNVLPAFVAGASLIVGGCTVALPEERLRLIGGREKILFGLRPEACIPAFDSAMITGKVEFMENTGNLKTVTLRLLDGSVFYLQDSNQSIALEKVAGFNFDWEKVCLFDAKTTVNLEG